ncbi:interferon-induced protein 44-like [Dreissena polymorpha]|uniref:TLDc domain-containing protein n=1 Tax=Dreissena polymorpha TaxID=45954 RepID=A0A9D4FHK5_DREPO|nr:interferon-induced protein 44-like [Dreissena polymorpha]XP_052223370.1 interferon-induced protein 44-like [Dreissena polymorpha]XP_052223371.1 interferon-induced protein 44-like [Dreissena polymorpha]KAH3798076.1 hypothetical protein DPMN_151666 [Dreissena polymorpha]
MAGQLRDSDKTQLEQWIGQGQKQFTLLYSVTKDGCTPQKFHEKCDHQGATVIVVYNEVGSVFGGYTSASWAVNVNGYTRDDKAFLFQLKFSNKDTFRKFPVSNVAYSIYSNVNNGPVFGGNTGFDMNLFSGTMNSTGGLFQLNGGFVFGANYTMTGVTNWNDIHNGNLKVKEIEVYSVAVKPGVTNQEWRKTPEWNKKLAQELMQEVQSIKPNPSLHIQDYRIVLIGPVGAGKSSFCNTVSSVLKGRFTQMAIVGKGAHSITTSYKPYSIKSKSESTLRMRLCDTRGIESDLGLDTMEFTYLLNGHIPENYKFNAEKPIYLDDPVFVPKPGLQDKIHCVVFVLDVSMIQKLDPKVVDKIKSFRTAASRLEIPQVLLLTKIDIEEQAVAKNLETVFSSSAIAKKVLEVSDMLGFPKNHVFPVKNYESEMMLDDGVNILALMALKQILFYAEDFVENQRAESLECPDKVEEHDFETASESI